MQKVLLVRADLDHEIDHSFSVSTKERTDTGGNYTHSTGEVLKHVLALGVAGA